MIVKNFHTIDTKNADITHLAYYSYYSGIGGRTSVKLWRRVW